MSDFTPDGRIPSPQDVARVATKLGRLNADELEVQEFFIDKMIAGSLKHGGLDLNSDTRDWVSEIAQENCDAAHYAVFQLIQRRRGLL